MGEGRYATLVETLEKAGYRRDLSELKPFQMLREVPIDDGEPVPVVIDLLAPKGVKLGGSRPPEVPGLRVQQIDGCGVAISHHIRKKLKGKMPDGRNNSVEIPVASIAASLVMKGYALTGRDKMKDAYDIYYSLRNYPGGPAKLGEDCRELLENPVAKKGFDRIRAKFSSRDDFGPETVRRFLEEAPPQYTDLDSEQVQTDAYGQVSAFLKSLGILD
ncbi:MAG: nucleotidyl transferase AbiEii/AbiGii toxin family protein [Verrucomicrobiales bacterium]